MKVSILDPGLAWLKGHHFDVDLRIARALARRGHEVELHGSAGAEAEVVRAAGDAGFEVRRTFRVFTYMPLTEGEPPETLYGKAVAATMDDLDAVQPSDLWFWPTLVPYQFMAAIWRPRPVKQAGGVWFTPRLPLAIGARTWARAARRLVRTPAAFVVGAYDELMREHYRSFSSGLDIDVAPTPHDGAVKSRRSQKLERIGFFGQQRSERGMAILPDLVEALLGRGYEVVLQDSSGSLRWTTGHPRLTTLAFVPDFAAEIAKCDLVVWPSSFEAYVANPSGVVSEAIATGVPVVLPSGCLPADIAVRYGCGIFFHDHSVAGVLDAVDGAQQNFAEHLARAETAAEAWRAHNGSDRLAEWLEARIQVRAGTDAPVPSRVSSPDAARPEPGPAGR